MQLMILCPQWGSEDLDLEDFLIGVKEAGYDGIDTWVPESRMERRRLRSLLEQYGLVMVSHQHQAQGKNITEFCKSFDYFLSLSQETNPLLINSHSGGDYFSFEDQLRVIDTALEFEARNGIEVVHETHRGRMLFCPQVAEPLFLARKDLRITADFSHWVCVTESYLEHFTAILEEASNRTRHVHARVGFPEGPQIPDPRHPAWQTAMQHFLRWWTTIIKAHKKQGAHQLTITTEFGPPPYMWTQLHNNEPVVSQWDVNLYMKELLRSIIY